MIRSLLTAIAITVSAIACASDVPTVDQQALIGRLEAKDASLVLLDVRTQKEFAEGHVPGAINISHDELASRLGELEGARDRDIVVYCRSGRRTGIALGVLEKAGFKRLYHLEGDYLAWTAAGRPLEKTAASPGG
jgi:rhodanese-related sulfurtransferase